MAALEGQMKKKKKMHLEKVGQPVPHGIVKSS